MYLVTGSVTVKEDLSSVGLQHAARFSHSCRQNHYLLDILHLPLSYSLIPLLLPLLLVAQTTLRLSTTPSSNTPSRSCRPFSTVVAVVRATASFSLHTPLPSRIAF